MTTLPSRVTGYNINLTTPEVCPNQVGEAGCRGGPGGACQRDRLCPIRVSGAGRYCGRGIRRGP